MRPRARNSDTQEDSELGVSQVLDEHVEAGEHLVSGGVARR
jgi:hypothetical protein